MRDDRDVDLLSDQLSSVQFDLIVSGSIAAVESVKWIRELRRYGASVRPFLTKGGAQFIQPLALEWAAKAPVVTESTGQAEHISFSDAIIVAPASLNFINKMSLGIADSPALAAVQSAIGRKPVFVFPSMHLSLEESPIYQEHRDRLKKIKHVHFFDSKLQEGKAKLLSAEAAVAQISHLFCRNGFRGLLTMGATRSYIDDVRFVSNESTGRVGISIADELYRSGFDIDIVSGPVEIEVPAYLQVTRVDTIQQMTRAVMALKKPRFAIFSAAVLDYEVKSKVSGKISSKVPPKIELKTAAKLIDMVKSQSCLKIGFKLSAGLSDQKFEALVREWNREKKCAYVVANRKEDLADYRAKIFDAGANEFSIVRSRQSLAQHLRRILTNQLKK